MIHNEWMDDGWMNGWMDDEWMDGQIDRKTDSWTAGWINRNIVLETLAFKEQVMTRSLQRGSTQR